MCLFDSLLPLSTIFDHQLKMQCSDRSLVKNYFCSLKTSEITSENSLSVLHAEPNSAYVIKFNLGLVTFLINNTTTTLSGLLFG